MSLYVVTLERVVVVEAESAREAEFEAQFNEREECSNGDADAYATLATERNIPIEWLDSRPYGRDDDLTVQQILDRTPPPPFVDVLTPDLFP